MRLIALIGVCLSLSVLYGRATSAELNALRSGLSTESEVLYLSAAATTTPSACPESICPCTEESEEPCHCELDADPVACTGVLTVTEDMLEGGLQVVRGEVGPYEADVSPTEITSTTTLLHFSPHEVSSCIEAFGGDPIANGWHMSVELVQRVPVAVETCPPTPTPSISPSITPALSPSVTASPYPSDGYDEEHYTCSDGDSPYPEISITPSIIPSGSPVASPVAPTPAPTPSYRTPSPAPTPNRF